MDNTKQSIRYRLIFVLAILAAWFVEIFPISNQDYFAYVDKESAQNIKSKLTDDATVENLRKAVTDAIEANNKNNTKKTREALIDAREDLDEVISNDEKEAFEKALPKLKTTTKTSARDVLQIQ